MSWSHSPLVVTSAVFVAGALLLLAGRRFGRAVPEAWSRYALEVPTVAWIVGSAALGGWCFAFVVCSTTAWSAWELRSVLKVSPRGRSIVGALGSALAAGAGLGAHAVPQPVVTLLEVVALLTVTIEALRWRNGRIDPPGVWLMVLPIASALALRRTGPATGPVSAAIALYGILEGADAAAYLVGAAFGRTPLAPTVSPRKTREGAIAAVVAGIVTGGWLAPLMRCSRAQGLWIGGALALGGLLADLATSALKRRAGTKDFAAWIPHHGGVLDMYDTLLVVAPAWGLLHG